MDFVTAIKTCMAKYVTFAGRAARSEYWFFILFLVLASIVCAVLDTVLFPGNQLSPLNSIFSLVTFLPSIAASVRRLHDIDKTGWWFLLWFIPIIGWIIMIIWHVKIGTAGSNRFGPDPLPAAVPA